MTFLSASPRCTLKCCYCQNYPISQGEVGKAISVERLTEIFMNLQNDGAKNINLITASQYLPWVTAALDAARLQSLAAPGSGDLLWITHAGVARCVQWLLQHGAAALPRADQWPLQAPAFGAWAVCELELKTAS